MLQIGNADNTIGPARVAEMTRLGRRLGPGPWHRNALSIEKRKAPHRGGGLSYAVWLYGR